MKKILLALTSCMLIASCHKPSFISERTIFDTGRNGKNEGKSCFRVVFGIPAGNNYDWKKIANDYKIGIPTSAKIESVDLKPIYESRCIVVRGQDISSIKPW